MMKMSRGGLAKGGMPALLAIPGKVKAESETDDYDDEAADADTSEGADLFKAVCEAKDSGDYAAGAEALSAFLDWYMGDEPEAEEEEAMPASERMS